eukprot:4211597-Pleurochrysis_carterae.AAC.2
MAHRLLALVFRQQPCASVVASLSCCHRYLMRVSVSYPELVLALADACSHVCTSCAYTSARFVHLVLMHVEVTDAEIVVGDVMAFNSHSLGTRQRHSEEHAEALGGAQSGAQICVGPEDFGNSGKLVHNDACERLWWGGEAGGKETGGDRGLSPCGAE